MNAIQKMLARPEPQTRETDREPSAGEAGAFAGALQEARVESVRERPRQERSDARSADEASRREASGTRADRTGPRERGRTTVETRTAEPTRDGDRPAPATTVARRTVTPPSGETSANGKTASATAGQSAATAAAQAAPLAAPGTMGTRPTASITSAAPDAMPSTPQGAAPSPPAPGRATGPTASADTRPATATQPAAPSAKAPTPTPTAPEVAAAARETRAPSTPQATDSANAAALSHPTVRRVVEGPASEGRSTLTHDPRVTVRPGATPAQVAEAAPAAPRPTAANAPGPQPAPPAADGTPRPTTANAATPRPGLGAATQASAPSAPSTPTAATPSPTAASHQPTLTGPKEGAPMKGSSTDAGTRIVNLGSAEGAATQAAERASVVTRPQAPAPTSDTARVLDQLAMHLKPRRPEVVVRLEPKELGRMVVRLAMRAGELSARITTSSERTARLLEADVPLLYRTLESNGIRVQEVQVHTQPGEEFEQSSEFQRSMRDHEEASSEAFERSLQEGDDPSAPGDAARAASRPHKASVSVHRSSNLDLTI